MMFSIPRRKRLYATASFGIQVGGAALDKIRALRCESLKDNTVFWSFDEKAI